MLRPSSRPDSRRRPDYQEHRHDHARFAHHRRAGTATIAYDAADTIDDVHQAIRRAHERGPFAQGPLGPEILSYDLVRTVLRDSRFTMPRGLALAVQGITSGPVWDRVCRLIISLDGAEHHRLRRLVSPAFTPRAPRGCGRRAPTSSPG